jgi:hypothetical protein
MNFPPGLKTRPIPRMASTTPGIAQGESTDNRIDGAVLQRDALARKVQELNSKLRLTPMLFCEATHARIGIQCIDPAHSCGIVVNGINAWANANLEDIPLAKGMTR